MNLLLLLAFMLPSQAKSNPPLANFAMADTAKIDTSRYAVLLFNLGRDGFIFNPNFKPTTISAEEIKMIEKIISVTVTEHNKQSKNGIDNPRKYYKQIIAATNASGQKEVWVNCFCTPYEKRHWRKGVVMILDGGPCFFNIKINLDTKTVMSFAVNGSS
ncbi:hypothetical protein [Mucilaginibacter psychrotolerans]|uniref:Uncharacterized protein n=1 Tax=Mucilaginibacter psychrotolerans TaxID=1524096 RepID=A0A4Y8S4M2_9SPHI|nr:hypothetical protein [Mucilaginibacter psychrotolerans]TFF33903.1 hypothetical protein E2R66_23790 [Mucilaginibacter psychrotolerans]